MCPLVPTETDADGWTKVLKGETSCVSAYMPSDLFSPHKSDFEKIMVNYNKIHRYQEIGQQITDS